MVSERRMIPRMRMVPKRGYGGRVSGGWWCCACWDSLSNCRSEGSSKVPRAAMSEEATREDIERIRFQSESVSICCDGSGGSSMWEGECVCSSGRCVEARRAGCCGGRRSCRCWSRNQCFRVLNTFGAGWASCALSYWQWLVTSSLGVLARIGAKSTSSPSWNSQWANLVVWQDIVLTDGRIDRRWLWVSRAFGSRVTDQRCAEFRDSHRLVRCGNSCRATA
jgi:hypothetical protein